MTYGTLGGGAGGATNRVSLFLTCVFTQKHLVVVRGLEKQVARDPYFRVGAKCNSANEKAGLEVNLLRGYPVKNAGVCRSGVCKRKQSQPTRRRLLSHPQ